MMHISKLLNGPYARLFQISFLVLFFELACIRWFGATVVFLTFFTNLVLMACFLGMSIGCLAASRANRYILWFFPIMVLAVLLANLALDLYLYSSCWIIDVGSQSAPQEVFFGAELERRDPGTFLIPIELVASVFFALIALAFVGLGQELGLALSAVPSRVGAYSINVLGSLLGTIVFSGLSYLRAPPLVWFGLAGILCLGFLPRISLWQAACALSLLTVMGLFEARESGMHLTFWSPYYKVVYEDKAGFIATNSIGHQAMANTGEDGGYYLLPHLLNRDSGGRPFENELIIGAGSGNDVAAALAARVRAIDAVEIDPVINEIGRRDHPEQPFRDPAVTIHLDDGRSFLRQTRSSYDLIAYALVDSLVLHSGYSSIRLESFLFTDQAMRDIRARLKKDGIFVAYNLYRQDWIVSRLFACAEKAFGAKPIVLSIPYRKRIGQPPTAGARGGQVRAQEIAYFTVLIAGEPGSRGLERIRRAFQEKSYFWLSKRPLDNKPINGYGTTPPDREGIPRSKWLRIGMSEVYTEGAGPIPTDDWPFLYLREATIPWLNVRGIAMITAISVILLLTFTRSRTLTPNLQMFFLGAGFMLLETKGVVHMALLFGSTWIVNSFVFASILVMILLANLFVLAFKPRASWPYFLLLFAALLVNGLVPMSVFLGLPGALRVGVSCAVVFVPVFFAGVIFASAFNQSTDPDIDFGSNIAGVILGGISEYLALVIGFNQLILLAIAYYVLAMVFRRRLPAPV